MVTIERAGVDTIVLQVRAAGFTAGPPPLGTGQEMERAVHPGVNPKSLRALRLEMDVLKARHELVVERWLHGSGWSHTSQTPGCVWRWTKVISGATYMVGRESAIQIQDDLDLWKEAVAPPKPEGA